MHPSSCPADRSPAERLGGFRIARVLRTTAFATSYAAHDPDGIPVHLKAYRGVRPGTERGEAFARAQRSVMERLRRVDSGVGTIRSFVTIDDHWVKASHWVEGRPLRDCYGELTTERSVTLAASLARTVAALHELEIGHRDLAPSNLLVGPGGMVVVDFDGAAVGAEPGHPLSSPPYAAPEHYGPTVPVDPRPGDVFTVGVVLYELLSGWFPYTREQIYDGDAFCASRFLAAVEGAALPLAEDFPDAPSALHSLLRRCLSLEPRRRPTADEVASVVAEL